MASVTRLAAAAGGLTLAALVALALAVGFGGDEPPPLAVATTAGFGPPDDREDGGTRWLEASTGRLEVVVGGRPRTVDVRLELSSFAVPRRADVLLGGRQVATAEVPPRRFVDVVAPLGTLATGRHEVELRVEPGPQSIAETVGVPDPRRVSVRIRAVEAAQRTS